MSRRRKILLTTLSLLFLAAALVAWKMVVPKPQSSFASMQPAPDFTLNDQDGKPFRIIEVPMPGVVEHDGQRLPATYLNFYFINKALLVPIYRHKTNDKTALDILQKNLPRHRVIGIDCVELIWGLGAIHCLTQQQPKF